MKGGAKAKRLTDQGIPGWFDFSNFYSRMVGEVREPAVFVEVGCWLGKSTCFLAQQIKQSGKEIQLFAVDTWKGSPNEPMLLETVKAAGGTLFPMFQRNLKRAGLSNYVQPIVEKSVKAAKGFNDASLALVFIDADHTYDAVKADILAWKPKLRPEGTLAGHDWHTYESVRRAVRDILGDNLTIEGNVWWVRASSSPQ